VFDFDLHVPVKKDKPFLRSKIKTGNAFLKLTLLLMNEIAV